MLSSGATQRSILAVVVAFEANIVAAEISSEKYGFDDRDFVHTVQRRKGYRHASAGIIAGEEESDP